MSSIAPRVLENDVWQVGILPQTGMSTAFGRVARAGEWVDFMRPTPEAAYGVAPECASYLLIPWSNRVKGGLFSFRGKDHQLKVNFPDGTAIHGTAKDYPWKVESVSRTAIAASFDSREHGDVNFPFAFSTRAEFRLDGARFESRISLKNEGAEPMPGGFGHHPYFQRTIAGVEDTVLLEVPCEEYFELENCIPWTAPIAVDERVDFRHLRKLVVIDDCLTGRIGDRPIRFQYPKANLNVTLEFDALFEHVIVYAPSEQTYFAVEPITNANDGFNLYARKIRGSGVFELEPGEERSAAFSLVVER